MIDLVSLGVFALALTLNAGSPGPSIAALVARVISNGWRDVMPFLSAMWIGEVLWLTLAMPGSLCKGRGRSAWAKKLPLSAL